MAQAKPVKVIAVTSGKGGVGKTNVTVNLATTLARAGRSVMLFDADLGLANVDVLLGLAPRQNLSHVLDGKASLEEVLLEGPEGVHIVPASSGTQRMAELSSAEHAGLIRSFSELSLDLDYLLVDTAAGISDSVVSFACAVREVLVVVCDEPSSITDAYALIKVLSREHDVGRFHVVANRVPGPREGKILYDKLIRVTDRFLDVTLDYLGAVPEDERLRAAVQRQRAVAALYPGSPSGRSFQALADRLEQWPPPGGADGGVEFFVERVVHAGNRMGRLWG